MNPKTYFDYASTTPLDPKVLREMMPFLRRTYGNPSSIHEYGQKAAFAVEKFRGIVSEFLNCLPEEVFFTGSATEADNLAILGVAKALGRKEKKLHVIVSAIEHHAVFEPCKILEKQGAEITYLPVNKEGMVSLSDLKKAIKNNTVLISIIYANNEIGTIQPIAEIGEFLTGLERKIYFHTDAVQAANYLSCDVKKLGVDMLTLSAHKIYGPKGVGALFIKKGTPIEPLVFGGGQERGLRPGTENVAGIVGLGAAVKEAGSPKSKVNAVRIRQLRDKILKNVPRLIPDVAINGSLENRLPNNINFSFEGMEGEALLVALDQKGFAVSTGSACSSKILESSHVLMALGVSEEKASASIRITLGKYSTDKEVERFLKVLPQVVGRLREISGYKTK
jgi:cysteine desulfurase